MAEAVGQLAAWAAMERCGFKRRPVAAIAARVTVRRAPAPGAELNLAVEIESCDETAIAYNGTAADASGPLLELEGSVGPMMPADEFDDPSELRKYFDQLTTTGVVDGLDRSALAEPNLTFGSCIEDKVSATLAVPESAAFFADHFPRKPVFPATLLLDAQVRIVRAIPSLKAARERGFSITDVKVRAFTHPGEILSLEAAVRSRENGTCKIALLGRNQEKKISTAVAEFLTLDA